MIDRVCISINNKCNLRCKYCHFREKEIDIGEEMDVFQILSNIKEYAEHPFKIGFVGNGEPLLDPDLLKFYIRYVSDNKWIQTYTITNGTIPLSEADIQFFEQNKVNVGFSLDGYRELHDMNRCGTFEVVMKNIEKFKSVAGHAPTLNATVGRKSLSNCDELIEFFEQFNTRITFSRMIGRYGISLDEFNEFLKKAETRLNVRRGGLDCTMYGGKCGAGTNNYFFANGKVFYCGNCVDLPPIADSKVSLYELEKISLQFDRTHCYKETIV